MKTLLIALLLIAPTCQSAPGEETPETLPSESGAPNLEAEARALADTTGCTDADACRTAPVGVKACGGPRDYLVYCATTTNTVALFAKLEELRRAEEAANRASGAVSTCEFVTPPGTELQGGSCRATSARVLQVP